MKLRLAQPATGPIEWQVSAWVSDGSEIPAARGMFLVGKTVRARLALEAWQEAKLQDREGVLLPFSAVRCQATNGKEVK